jgi:hypothetical protein
MGARIIPFFEKVTETFSYLVIDPRTQAAAIIDPVLDYDPAAGRIRTHSADAIAKMVQAEGLQAMRFPGRRCADALSFHPAASGIAAANPAIHVPRLCPGRARLCVRVPVAEERAQNVHVHDGVTEDAFVARRTARDATLDTPRLFLPSLQVNMRAGELPPPESNGRRYFKIPIEASTL